MKVAWVHNFPPEVAPGGVFMHRLAREVVSQGVAVVPVYTGSLRRPGSILSAVHRLTKLVAGCDLVHAQYGSACGYVAARLKGVKAITLRGSDWYGVPPVTWKARLHGLASRWLTRKSLPAYDVILTVSERMKRSVKEASAGRPVVALPSGIDLRTFAPIDRAKARQELDCTDDGAPWALFAAVDPGSPVKRMWLANAAVELARKDIPSLKLRLATRVPPDRMPLEVNACDVLLLTSSHEGWPNIVKEALACNVPFVSTDVSDLREIADAEPNCFVAEPEAEALARALVAALRHARTSSLRRHVEPMHTPKIAARLVSLYARLLGQPDRAPEKESLP